MPDIHVIQCCVYLVRIQIHTTQTRGSLYTDDFVSVANEDHFAEEDFFFIHVPDGDCVLMDASDWFISMQFFSTQVSVRNIASVLNQSIWPDWHEEIAVVNGLTDWLAAC